MRALTGFRSTYLYRNPQMFIVQRTGKRPSLPQPAADTLSPVEMLRVAKVQRPEHAFQRIRAIRYAYQMNMVGHKAIGQDLQPVYE